VPVAGFAAGVPVSGTVADTQTASNPHTIMHPDYATMLKWFQAHEAMPKAPMAPREALLAPGASLSLLPYLDYVPSQRNQGWCGDCWCWAGHGCMEILLDLQNGVFDRLSVQEMNSCESAVIGLGCCDGGWLSDLQEFYSAPGYQRAIPWSNSGAYWQDGYASCTTTCASVTTTPNYPVQSITAHSITTYGVGQAQAIANIKAILNQNKPVAFAFFLATQSDWNTFDNFWDSQSETTSINLDYACGHSWDSGGGGHEVLCVGYNDDNPNDPYWIMVNSWGITSGRPNGIFHVSMTNNYNCTFYENGYTYHSYYWEYLDVTYTPLKAIFSATPTNGTAPLAVSFTDSSTGTITNRFWNFGDGSTTNFAVASNPMHTYTAGTYNVTLIVSGSGHASTNMQANLITASVVQSYTISTSSSPSAGGTASGGGTYTNGAIVMVTATANTCYSFVNWTEGGTVVSTFPSYTFTVNANRNLVANFTPVTYYTITTSSSPVGGGSTSGGGTVLCGSNATVCATSNPCYSFVNWTLNGSVVSSLACYTFTATANETLVANFSQIRYTINTSSSPPSGGTTSGGGTYNCGASATVVAISNPSFAFVNWTENGNVVTNSPSYTFAVSTNRTLAANFGSLPTTILADAGDLFDQSGTLAPTDSVAVLVVDTGTNGFADPRPDFPLSLGAAWGTEDKVVGLWDLNACQCGPGELYDQTVVAYTNGIAPGQKLQLYWFPSLTLASNTLGVTFYGKYTDTNNPPLDGSDAWQMPATGTNVHLKFWTTFWGGSNPESAGRATLITGAPMASFTANPADGPAPLTVMLTDTSTGVVSNRFWDFGDGITTNITNTVVLHTYSAGTYTITLVVSGPEGASTNIHPDYVMALTPFQSWQIQYFHRINNPSGAPDVDADGTGQNNFFKYVAGLDPTNPASVFVLNIASATNRPPWQNLGFSPFALGRTYTPQFSTNLVSGVWLPLTTYTGLLTNGNQVTFTDTNPIPPQQFYRLHISLP
jgi:PKD repeat protein